LDRPSRTCDREEKTRVRLLIAGKRNDAQEARLADIWALAGSVGSLWDGGEKVGVFVVWAVEKGAIPVQPYNDPLRGRRGGRDIKKPKN